MSYAESAPEHWVITKLGEVCESCSQREPTPDEEFIYIDIGSVDRDEKSIKEPQQLLGSNAPSRARKIISSGDVLVSMTRPNLNAVALVPDNLNGQIASTGFEVLRPKLVSSELIFHVTRSQPFVDKMSAKVQGALYPAVKSSDIREFEFPLPPLAEQKQIAAKLDELLAQVDILKARLDAIPAILKRFRQSVLTAAVSGLLTEEWREEHKFTLSEFPSAKRSDVLPNAWRVIPLGEYVGNLDNQRVPISAEERAFRKGAFPYYGASGQIDTIDDHTHDGEFVLIGEDGANLLARSKPIAFIVKGKVWVNNHAHVLSVKPGFSNQYFEYFVNSLNLAPWVSGTAQPKLNQKNMNTIPVNVPPKEEQTEIVHRVEQLLAFADQIEQRVRDAQTRVNHLAQSILAKAFRGELTADWRAQNPDLISGENSAEALLARIRAARAGQPKAKRGRRRAATDR